MRINQTSVSAKDMEKMLAVSPYNRIALEGNEQISGVKIFDTTLRDGEQAPGIALSSDDKVRIALALDDLGVDIMEAGFAASSQSERNTLKRIADSRLDAQVCSLARSVITDIDAVLTTGLDSIHTFIATSDLHMKYKLKMTPEQVKERAVETVEYAKDHGLNVQFSCEDATRSNLDFMKEVLIAVQDVHVDSINIPDTVGVITPKAMAYLISEIKKVVKVPIAVHCHNDMGLALANTIAAVEAGARICHVCMNGIGERTGNASMEELALNLFANYGVETIDLSKIGQTSKLVERITGFPMAYNKPIVGRNAFAHESGIHVHGVMTNTATYEPFLPELVGVDRHIVIGKHSGVHSVQGRLEVLGIDFPEKQMDRLMAAIKDIAVGGKQIDDAELITIADHIMWKNVTAVNDVDLMEFAVFTGKDITSTATVTVDIAGERRTVSEIGVGPVDAAINAIRKAVNDKMSMEEYKLSAITGKSDSICEVTVMVKNVQGDGSMSVGKAVGVDIVETSVDATMAAINRDYARQRNDNGKDNS
ncbi:MAG TPA: 2-isopropylmalate synthase [Candidatus Methanomethylophilaceae archaeon]|nr:2-isopropylmalate synthase [Candidatus Methanomethylophilaceae archaeon]